MKVLPFVFVAAITGIAVLALMVLESDADDVVFPFECVPELGLSHIEARSIWVGYDNGGWDVPDDVELIYRYNREWIDTYRVYYSASADEYYVFVYDTLPVDEGKGYLSWHPCGQGAVSVDDYIEVIG
jgi:hypothetical protein